MDAKQLLQKFIDASTEVDVTKIIKSHPVLSDDDNWRPYGNANNIGTVTGQNPEAVPSLSEKITNSLDALLIKACLEHGEDPQSKSSPNTMEEALKRYFALTEDKYEGLSEAKRRELAEKVQISEVGSKENPNIVVYDEGEGQHPKDFPRTFLSLGGDNKRKIFFVQGKYNMGGAAVLPFCGDRGETGYQLILSKKNLSSDNSGKFGFTLLRRNWGIGKHIKSSWYEYFVDPNGDIFEFDSEPLDIALVNSFL
ncbi:MAG: hypothetical protein IIB05_08515 [Bacteroidetes bacterium]|nr:hypothetical protein [Bacteroidota bacterium]